MCKPQPCNEPASAPLAIDVCVGYLVLCLLSVRTVGRLAIGKRVRCAHQPHAQQRLQKEQRPHVTQVDACTALYGLADRVTGRMGTNLGVVWGLAIANHTAPDCEAAQQPKRLCRMRQRLSSSLFGRALLAIATWLSTRLDTCLLSLTWARTLGLGL